MQPSIPPKLGHRLHSTQVSFLRVRSLGKPSSSCPAGGCLYELGPFASALDAAQAHDRYSLLLYGLSAQTNFPPWGYLASEKEVVALAEAVHTVLAAKAVQTALVSSPPGEPPLAQEQSAALSGAPQR